MSKVNTGQASSTLIPKYIGSDFDKVVAVTDNIEQVVLVGDNVEDVGTVADNINYVKEVAEDLHGMPVTMYTGENPPVLNPMPEGVMWYCTTDGRTYVWYTDADSGQWVESAPQSAMKDEATNIFFHSTPSNVNPAYRNATLFSTSAPEAEISVAHNALNTPVVQAQFIREEALWVDVSVTGAQGIVTLMGYSSGNSQLKAEIITWKNGAEGTSLGASQWVTLPSQPSVVSLPVTLANIDVLDAGDSYVVRLTSQMNAGGSAVSTILVDGNTSSRFGIIFNTNMIGLFDGIRDGVTTSAPTENAVYDALSSQSGVLTPIAGWADVPMQSHSVLGGPDGPMNAQAKALTARSELLLTDVREALRRSYAEAGYNLVDGSFEAGGTLVNANDVLLQERTGKAFSGPAGAVAAGTNPAIGGFVDRSSELLRGVLAAPAGPVDFVRKGLRDFVSIRDYFSAAEMDWSGALQRALNSGVGGVNFPGNGTYEISTEQSVPSNVVLFSNDKATIKQADNANLQNMFRVNAKSRVGFRGLKIDINRANQSAYVDGQQPNIGRCVLASNTFRLSIYDCEFPDMFGTAVQVVDSTEVDVDKVRIQDQIGTYSSYGLYLVRCGHIRVRGSRFYGVRNYGTALSTYGVHVKDSPIDVVIDGNYFFKMQCLVDGSENGGTTVNRGSSVEIVNNVLMSTTADTTIRYCRYGKMANNITRDSGDFGLSVGNCSEISVDGNIVEGSNTVGIGIVNSPDCSVTNNKIKDPCVNFRGLSLVANQRDGIYVAGNCTRTVITGNTITDFRPAGSKMFHGIMVQDVSGGTPGADTSWALIADNSIYGSSSNIDIYAQNVANVIGLNYRGDGRSNPVNLGPYPNAVNKYGDLRTNAIEKKPYYFDGDSWCLLPKIVTVPATATSPGQVGDIAMNSSYLYVCHAANTWKRVALTTW